MASKTFFQSVSKSATFTDGFVMARRLEITTVYPEVGLQDEWSSYNEVNTHGWSDSEVIQFVRDFNKKARLEGVNYRLRSVEDEEVFY